MKRPRILARPFHFIFRILALFQDLIAQDFRDLNGIQRRPLAQIVGHAPEVDAIVDRDILPNAADECGVIADAFHWADIAAIFALIDHHNAR